MSGRPESAVVAAVELTLAVLSDRRVEPHRAPGWNRRHQHVAREELKVLSDESLVMLMAAESLAHGITPTDDDRTRLALAATRIRAAREVAA